VSLICQYRNIPNQQAATAVSRRSQGRARTNHTARDTQSAIDQEPASRGAVRPAGCQARIQKGTRVCIFWTLGLWGGGRGGVRTGKDLHAAILESGREDKQVGLVRDGDERRLHLDEVGHRGKVSADSQAQDNEVRARRLRGSRAIRTYKNATLPLCTRTESHCGRIEAKIAPKCAPFCT